MLATLSGLAAKRWLKGVAHQLHGRAQNSFSPGGQCQPGMFHAKQNAADDGWGVQAYQPCARRNRLIGMWAAEKLGLSGAEAEAYASQLRDGTDAYSARARKEADEYAAETRRAADEESTRMREEADGYAAETRRAADLYAEAFLIPDYLFFLMAGGYLSITLVPILSRFHAADDDSTTVSHEVVLAPDVDTAIAAMSEVVRTPSPLPSTPRPAYPGVLTSRHCGPGSGSTARPGWRTIWVLIAGQR